MVMVMEVSSLSGPEKKLLLCSESRPYRGGTLDNDGTFFVKPGPLSVGSQNVIPELG